MQLDTNRNIVRTRPSLRSSPRALGSGKRFTTEQRELLASAVFDSFVFAGGLSVPSIISTALGVLYGKDFATKRAASGIDSNNLNTSKFAMEERGGVGLSEMWYGPNAQFSLFPFELTVTLCRHSDGC